jgi:hypothetical protein
VAELMTCAWPFMGCVGTGRTCRAAQPAMEVLGHHTHAPWGAPSLSNQAEPAYASTTGPHLAVSRQLDRSDIHGEYCMVLGDAHHAPLLVEDVRIARLDTT